VCDDNDVEVTMVMKYQPAICHCEVTSLLMSKDPQMVNKVQKSGLRGRTSGKKQGAKCSRTSCRL